MKAITAVIMRAIRMIRALFVFQKSHKISPIKPKGIE
jgi:hypothetical protein